MSDHLPYGDEQSDELPLPDSEASWQKMKLLLNKEDKRRRVIPLIFLRYAGLALLLLISAGGSWLLLYPEKKLIGTTAQGNKVHPDTKKESAASRTTQGKTGTPQEDSRPGSLPSGPFLLPPEKAVPPDNILPQGRLLKEAVIKSRLLKKGQGLSGSDRRKAPDKKLYTRNQDLNAGTRSSNDIPQLSNNKTTSGTKSNDTVARVQIKLKDSTKSIPVPVVEANPKKEKAAETQAFVLSAGAGLQQSIAISGQQTTSYNYRGGKGALSDRIPSVYVGVQKGKWWAQSEFMYGVPQPVKAFSFSRTTRYDMTQGSLVSESYSILKIYYHQLPLSLNYQVLPHFSVGAGGQYNLLAGAVTEQKVATKNIQSGTEQLATYAAPVQGFKDSFLYKTTASMILQANYRRKQLSLGLRYTRHLQPFIKYIEPGGEVVTEKNSSLQAILRFRLWKNG